MHIDCVLQYFKFILIQICELAHAHSLCSTHNLKRDCFGFTINNARNINICIEKIPILKYDISIFCHCFCNT